jgi:hypothetical protein
MILENYPDISPVSFSPILLIASQFRQEVFDQFDALRKTPVISDDSLHGENEKYLSHGEKLAQSSKQLVDQNDGGSCYYVVTVIKPAKNESIGSTNVVTGVPALSSSIKRRVANEIYDKEMEYLRDQEDQYQMAKNELLDKYDGKYIFFENGEVKEYSDNKEELIARVHTRYGIRDILVKLVMKNEPQLRRIYTPFIPNILIDESDIDISSHK